MRACDGGEGDAYEEEDDKDGHATGFPAAAANTSCAMRCSSALPACAITAGKHTWKRFTCAAAAANAELDAGANAELGADAAAWCREELDVDVVSELSDATNGEPEEGEEEEEDDDDDEEEGEEEEEESGDDVVAGTPGPLPLLVLLLVLLVVCGASAAR
jgi:hypothetical protein